MLSEIEQDMRSGRPMNRLLQGDVGSGKTIVSLLSMLKAVESGYQAVLMAPTEILAEQHLSSVLNYVKGMGAPGRVSQERRSGGGRRMHITRRSRRERLRSPSGPTPSFRRRWTSRTWGSWSLTSSTGSA